MDSLITNFHLPESTLLMLVSSGALMNFTPIPFSSYELTAAEFLDGLPVVPGLSVEEYLKELFGNQGISSEDILEQLGQELGVSTEAALEQLRKAYETAEKEDKPLRLLNR